jgi:polyadenylation factor subunit 2
VTTHQHPIRAMTWSTNGQMLLSGDHEGIIKYFNASMTNVKNISDAHESAVRGLSFAPSESKYVSCR